MSLLLTNLQQPMNDLIDYSEESTDDLPIRWTHNGFKKYFYETYWKIHHTGGSIPWTLKETVLMKTMMDEYEADDLADMIVYWHTSTHKPSVACRFVDFYSNRVDIYLKTKKANGAFNWD